MLCALLCLSCSHRALHEAQSVVAAADSLRTVGQPYTDSTQLAQAYTTLKHWQNLRPDDYARACYHYGRLLRSAEHYPEAMTCFINATHSRSTDYHILGRVYSNMGSLCHFADELSLSYDMYDRSSQMFLRAGDSISYFYALNDMAFELAEQGNKEEVLAIISNIEANCTDEFVLIKILETKADAYLYAQQYDSAIYYAKLLYKFENYDPTGLLITAQAYSLMGQKDSAVHYAEFVLANSSEIFDINNALYILTNDDDEKDRDEVRQVASDRSDTQKLIENRKGEMTKAVLLLEQDLHRTPDRRWLYAVAITICIIGLLLALYVRRKSRQHRLLSQQVADLENSNNVAKQRHNQIVQMHTDYTENMRAQIEQKCLAMTQSETFLKDICWKDYNNMCVIVNRNFGMLAAKLRKTYHLPEQDIRLCVLVLLNFNRTEISNILHYGITGIGKMKYRVAQKLGTEGKLLRNYLISMVIDEPQNDAEMKLPTSQNNHLSDNQ